MTSTDDECEFLQEVQRSHIFRGEKKGARKLRKSQPKLRSHSSPLVQEKLPSYDQTKSSRNNSNDSPTSPSDSSKTQPSCLNQTETQQNSKSVHKETTSRRNSQDSHPVKIRYFGSDRPGPKSKKRFHSSNTSRESCTPKIDSKYEKIQIKKFVDFKSRNDSCSDLTKKWKYKAAFQIKGGWKIGLELEPKTSTGFRIQALVNLQDFYPDQDDSCSIWIIKKYYFQIELVHYDETIKQNTNKLVYSIDGAQTTRKRYRKLKRLYDSPPFIKDSINKYLVVDEGHSCFQTKINMNFKCLKLTFDSMCSGHSIPCPTKRFRSSPSKRNISENLKKQTKSGNLPATLSSTPDAAPENESRSAGSPKQSPEENPPSTEESTAPHATPSTLSTNQELVAVEPNLLCLSRFELNRYQELRRKGKEFDVTLKAQGLGRGLLEFRAHKAVLAYRSSALVSKLKENVPLELNVSKEILETFLDFCYNGELSFLIGNPNTHFSLLELSTKDVLDIPDLYQFCRDQILPIKNIRHALDVLQWAEKNSLNEFKDSSINYIKKSVIKHILLIRTT